MWAYKERQLVTMLGFVRVKIVAKRMRVMKTCLVQMLGYTDERNISGNVVNKL